MSPPQDRYGEEVICPHCGYEHDTSYEWFSEGQEDVELECAECEREFIASIIYDIHYRTKAAPL